MKYEKTEYQLPICFGQNPLSAGPKRRYEAAADSFTGLVRKRNEDSYAYAWDDSFKNLLAIVADGIGSTRDGDIASLYAVRMLMQAWRKQILPEQYKEPAVRTFLRNMIREINRRLFEINEVASCTGERDSLGTTLTAAVFLKHSVIAVNTGDSPMFRIRSGQIEQLTFDHNLANELVRNGQASREEADRLKYGRMLTRFIGPKKWVEPELYRSDVCPGDCFLLCSDGLTLHVPPLEICQILDQEANIAAAVKTLLCKTMQRGAKDNATVILVKAL